MIASCHCTVCAQRRQDGLPVLDGVSLSSTMHLTEADFPPTRELREEQQRQKEWLRQPAPSPVRPAISHKKTVRRISDAALAAAIGESIGAAMRVAEERSAALQAEIAGLRSVVQEFRFVPWSENKTFRAGNFTSLGGAIYACVADTSSKPGTDASWALACPKPRDGRDFTPPPTPAEPERRTVRSSR